MISRMGLAEQINFGDPTLIGILILVGIAVLVLKGIALYKSARRGQKIWFVCLLIFNTLGILPIIYLITHKKK